jgi:hypothetical protein
MQWYNEIFEVYSKYIFIMNYKHPIYILKLVYIYFNKLHPVFISDGLE